MLSTSLALGKKLLEGTGNWAFVTTEPKLGKAENHHICPIVFDLENQKIVLDKDGAILYKQGDEAKYRYINPEKWGRRGKKFALTTEPRRIKMMKESFFGKKKDTKGSAQISLEEYDGFEKSELYKALTLINDNFNLSDFDEKEIKKEFNYGKNDEVAIFYSKIKSEKIRNGKSVALFKLEGFEKFIFKKFGPKAGKEGLDYLTGQITDEVEAASFERGYNLNAIFQTTSNNFASYFSDFSKNFKTDPKNALALDKASKYYLNNLSTRIAGLNHLIIPNYRKKDIDQIEWENEKEYLSKTSDFLFQYQPIHEKYRFTENKLFWVNYLAYESDGNSFKVTNQFKDISNKWLEKLIEAFARTGISYDKYVGDKYHFNLQTVYNIIPVVKVSQNQDEPINRALLIFKDILEQRKIDQAQVYSLFKELLLCHFYGRYVKYKNIKDRFSSFDYAVKDAVFKYQLLLKVLNNLNLIIMENNEQSENSKNLTNSDNEMEKAIIEFFDEMDYSSEQKALFYLGRVVSQVGDAQYQKKHKNKPVLNKINFDGMDADALMRLANDLSEKGVQYSIHGSTDWNLSKFHNKFKKKNWPLSRDENIFYLMAGYTFKLTQKNKS